ncbi:MAG: hypothetical protein J0H00_06460 [Burkholderiales bacterium]|nr:hypothetical protein [Burkholderiales bacterium]
MSTLYVMTHTESKAQRLVRAANQAQAFRHVARSDWKAAPANPETVYELASSGIRVEDATADPGTDD